MQSSKALMLIKQVKNPTLIGDVNTHILYFYKYFVLLYRTKEPVTLPQNHVVEHRITRTDIEDKRVLLEETAVAHVNPL